MSMVDYSECLIALKQEQDHLEAALLHGENECVPQIIANMEAELFRLRNWLWKEKGV
jgi:hypothetical protein